MEYSYLAFILSTIAGLSTLLGTFFIFIHFKHQETILISALSFAAGVMITVSCFDLIPSSFQNLNADFYMIPSCLLCMIGICIGVILSIFIDEKIPSKSNQLKRVGMISFIAIILHNIPEGIATYLTANRNIDVGIALTCAIALHNIPEGISISIPIYYSSNSRLKAFLYTLISSLSEPLGAIIAFLFLSTWITPTIMGMIYAMIAGIMIHISCYELLPTALQYHQRTKTFFFFFLGTIVMLFSHIFI